MKFIKYIDGDVTYRSLQPFEIEKSQNHFDTNLDVYVSI